MATRTISNTGGNWSTTGAWVEAAVPTVSDALSANATSGNLIITALSCICASMVIPAYVRNIQLNGKLTVAGAVTLAGSMSGTGEFVIGNSSTAGSVNVSAYPLPGHLQEPEQKHWRQT
jgi:hypothetical protein